MKMLCQEDIMEYFEFLAQETRENNMPVFNNFIHEYPGFANKEELLKEIAEEDSESEDELEPAKI